MAKKKRGLFDFNHDGKTDSGEKWMAFQIFEDTTEKDDDGDDDDFDDFSSSDTDDWDDDCDDTEMF